jgi:hypothetical protein
MAWSLALHALQEESARERNQIRLDHKMRMDALEQKLGSSIAELRCQLEALGKSPTPQMRPPGLPSVVAARVGELRGAKIIDQSPLPHRPAWPPEEFQPSPLIPSQPVRGVDHRDLVRTAWKKFFSADSGNNKGNIDSLRTELERACGSKLRGAQPHPANRNVAVIRIVSDYGNEEHLAVPLWHEFASIEEFFSFDGGDSFTKVGGLARVARLDPVSDELLERGIVTP